MNTSKSILLLCISLFMAVQSAWCAAARSRYENAVIEDIDHEKNRMWLRVSDDMTAHEYEWNDETRFVDVNPSDLTAGLTIRIAFRSPFVGFRLLKKVEVGIESTAFQPCSQDLALDCSTETLIHRDDPYRDARTQRPLRSHERLFRLQQ